MRPICGGQNLRRCNHIAQQDAAHGLDCDCNAAHRPQTIGI
jgi:hypothetical protein